MKSWLINKNLVLISVILTGWLNVFSQQIVRIDGGEKPIITFNDLKFQMNIASGLLPDNNKIGITIDVINDNNDYNFYLFSDNEPTNDIKGQEISYLSLLKWVQSKNKMVQGDPLARKSKFSFNGKFSEYNYQYIRRTEWDSFYKFVNRTRNNFDSYSLTDQVKPDTKLTLKYYFLITIKSGKNEKLIGISKPIVYSIPQPVISELINKIESEIIQEKLITEQWIKKVDEELLVYFISKNAASYNDIVKDTELLNYYNTNNFNKKIINAIEQIKSDLANDAYIETRSGLIAKLEPYLQTGKPIQASTTKESEQDLALDKTKPAEKPATRIVKPSTSSKKTSANCSELKKQFVSIDNQGTDLYKTLRSVEDLISVELVDFEDNMNSCELIKCYKEIKKHYDSKNWKQTVVNSEKELNQIKRNYTSLTQDEDFKKCNIETKGFEKLIKRCHEIRNGIENNLNSFEIKLEAYLIDKDPFEETVREYKGEIENISFKYNRLSDLYIAFDDRFFNAGKLKRSEIKVLKQAIITTDSIERAIDSILPKASTYYLSRTLSGNFPEATFISETHFSINLADCIDLKLKMQDLVNRSQEVLPGFGYLFFLGVIGVILIISVYYYLGVVRKKVYNNRALQNNNNTTSMSAGVNSTALNSSDDSGIEIIEDDEEINKGKGLDTVKKLVGLKYFEVDVQSFIKNTTVRKVYFSNEFIIKAYRYFEDKILGVGNGDIDDLYEYGGYIIGNWDNSAYSDDQYELSLEHFIEPGDDAKFSKFNIDFGYSISFNMEELLIDLANKGNEQVFVGWLHSHPGHNVFLSNYDIEVQERFRNQYHPNRHIALVLEPTTPKWDLGLFSFNKDGEMNNKEEVQSFLSFHELYNWAMDDKQSTTKDAHLEFNFTETDTISFDRSALLQLKIYVERELPDQSSEHKYFNLFGVKPGNGVRNSKIHLVKIEDSETKVSSKLEIAGLFTALTDEAGITDFVNAHSEEIKSLALPLILIYNINQGKFSIIPLNDGQIDEDINRIDFTKNEILPFLSK